MNLESKQLGKSIVITVSAAFLLDTAINVAFALRDGSTELIGGFVFSLTLFAILYVNFWRAKEWARYLLAFFLILRCGMGFRILLVDATAAKTFSTFDILFLILFGVLGISILTVPGVRHFLQSINSSAKRS